MNFLSKFADSDMTGSKYEYVDRHAAMRPTN